MIRNFRTGQWPLAPRQLIIRVCDGWCLLPHTLGVSPSLRLVLSLSPFLSLSPITFPYADTPTHTRTHPHTHTTLRPFDHIIIRLQLITPFRNHLFSERLSSHPPHFLLPQPKKTPTKQPPSKCLTSESFVNQSVSPCPFSFVVVVIARSGPRLAVMRRIVLGDDNDEHIDKGLRSTGLVILSDETRRGRQ
jgi:hypothetical protein